MNLFNIFLGHNQFDENIFQSLQHAVALQQIQLQDNRIQKLFYKILPTTFQLEILELQQNVISEVDANSFIGMDVLKYLDLSQNAIDEVKREMFQPLSTLAGLNLEQNPLICSCNTRNFQDWLKEEPASLISDIDCYDPIFGKYTDVESGYLDYLCNDTFSTGSCNAPCAAGATISLDTTVSDTLATLTWDYKLISDTALVTLDCKVLESGRVTSFVFTINTTSILLENLQSEKIYSCCILVYKCDLYTCDSFTAEGDDYTFVPCSYKPYIISIVIISVFLIVLLIIVMVLVLTAKKITTSNRSHKSGSLADTQSQNTLVFMDPSFNSRVDTKQSQIPSGVPLRKRPLPNPNERESTYEHIPLDFEQEGQRANSAQTFTVGPSAFHKDSIPESQDNVKVKVKSHHEVEISETKNITSTYLTPVDSKEKAETTPRKPRRFVRPSKLNKNANPSTPHVKSASFECLNITSNSDGQVSKTMNSAPKQNSASSDSKINDCSKDVSIQNIRNTCPGNIYGEGVSGPGCYQEIFSDNETKQSG